MIMKAVIPAKALSSRVPNKNYRPFHGIDSLVDLMIHKLKRCLAPEDIYLSCENKLKCSVTHQHGIKFLLRDERLADNDVPFAEFVGGVCADVPGDGPVLWCEVIDPFFDEHQAVLDLWSEVSHEHDSLVVVYPVREYLLNGDHLPLGFGFGPWHVKSQLLPTFYRLNFTCSILTRRAIRECGYMVGCTPAWYEAKGHYIDIDTETDFRLAQLLYMDMQARHGPERTTQT